MGGSGPTGRRGWGIRADSVLDGSSIASARTALGGPSLNSAADSRFVRRTAAERPTETKLAEGLAKANPVKPFLSLADKRTHSFQIWRYFPCSILVTTMASFINLKSPSSRADSGPGRRPASSVTCSMKSFTPVLHCNRHARRPENERVNRRMYEDHSFGTGR